MKKYLYNIVIATLILISTTVVNASNEVYYTNRQNIAMTESEYNNLLGLGFTEKQIELMDEEVFLENKDIEATFLESTDSYQMITTTIRNGIKYQTIREITEEEAMEEKELQSQDPTRGPAGNYYDGLSYNSVQQITTSIAGISNTRMRFKVDSNWIVIPSERYYDILAIGIEASKVQIASTIVCRENWKTTGGVYDYQDTYYPKTESTGGSAIIELPSGNLEFLNSYLYFNVSKKSGVGTITSLVAGGDYAHAIASVNPSNVLSHYSVNYVGGISIDSTYDSSYSSISVAHASFSGTW